MSENYQSPVKKYDFQTISRFGDTATIPLRFNDGIMSLATDLKFSQVSEPSNLYRNNTGSAGDSRLAALRLYVNIYDVMYQGSIDLRNDMSAYFNRKLNAIYLKHGLILMSQIVLLAILAIILLRFVFQIQAANKDVIKLFSMIEQKEIKTLRQNCIKFIKENLMHFLDSKEKNNLIKDDNVEERLNVEGLAPGEKEDLADVQMQDNETGRQQQPFEVAGEKADLKKARMSTV